MLDLVTDALDDSPTTAPNVPTPALPADIRIRGGDPAIGLDATATLTGGVSATLGGGAQPLQALVGTVKDQPIALVATLTPLTVEPLEVNARVALAPTQITTDMKVGFSVFGLELCAITLKGKMHISDPV